MPLHGCKIIPTRPNITVTNNTARPCNEPSLVSLLHQWGTVSGAPPDFLLLLGQNCTSCLFLTSYRQADNYYSWPDADSLPPVASCRPGALGHPTSEQNQSSMTKKEGTELLGGGKPMFAIITHANRHN